MFVSAVVDSRLTGTEPACPACTNRTVWVRTCGEFSVTVNSPQVLTQTVRLVQAGQAGSVPVNLLSTTALTNMAFTVSYPPGRLTNFSVTVNSPQVLTQTVR